MSNRFGSELEDFESFLQKQKSQDVNFASFLRDHQIKATLKFNVAETEQRYQDHLNTPESLSKYVWACVLITAGHLVWGARDLFQFLDWYHRDAMWIPIDLRMILLGICFVSLFLLYIPRLSCLLSDTHYDRFRSLVLQNHRIFPFILCYASGVAFSLFFFSYTIEKGLPWAPHVCALLVPSCMLPHHFLLQISSGVLQIVLFTACAMVAGYDQQDIINCGIYLSLFWVLSSFIAFANEQNSRQLFVRQQMTLFFATRDSCMIGELMQQARVAEISKSCFITNISHEIRTPLHGVMTALDLLKSSGILSTEQDDYIQIAENSSELLLDILNNVLTISKIQSGKVTLESKPIDFRQIIESIAAVFSQIGAQKGVEVAAYVPPTCPIRLLCDPMRLKQILFNLVSNAVKFTPEGHVQIRVAVEEETPTDVSLTISVADSGIGVAPDQLHLLFQRFSQLDDSSTRKFQGTGLGLALVFEFAKLFGGHMSVHSFGLGHGTTFSFTARFLKDPNYSSVSIVDFPDKLLQSPYQWTTFVLHKVPSIAEICSVYLSHLGLDPKIISLQNMENSVTYLSEFIRSRLTRFLEDPDGDNASSDSCCYPRVECAPCCVVIDHSLCGDPKILESLRAIHKVARHISRAHRNSNAEEKPALSLCPLFIIVLDDPSRTGETNFPSLHGWHVWSLKKPCRLQRLEDTVHAIRAFLASSRCTPDFASGDLRSQRRFSAPSIAFSGQKKPRERVVHRFDQRTSLSEGHDDRRRSWAIGGGGPSTQSPRGEYKNSVKRQSLQILPPSPSSSTLLRPSRRSHQRSSQTFVSFEKLSEFRFGGGSQTEREEDILPTTEDTSSLTPCAKNYRKSSLYTNLEPFSSESSGDLSDHVPQEPLSVSSSTNVLPPAPSLQTLDSPPNLSPPPILKRRSILSVGGAPQTSTLTAAPSSQPQSEIKPVVEPHKKIMVADDNHVNRKLTERLLVKAGFQCTSVEDGQQAVDAAMREQFALIFMDITMPVMDGCTATRLIQERQNESGGPKTIICALSAAEKDQFAHANFDAILPKPVKSAELVATARELTERYREQQEFVLRFELSSS